MISLSLLSGSPKVKVAVKLLAFVCLLQMVHCDSSTSTASYLSSSIIGMEPLLKTERQLLCAMENYAILLAKKLSIIRGAIAEMRAENQKSKNNAEEYLSNPINSYALIRRLHEDWVRWQLFLERSVGTDDISRIEKLRAEAPSSLELSSATEAIYRLQIVSDLKPADMAIGILNGRQYDVRFSAMDCYSIGYELLSNEYYNLSAIWLNISLELFQDGEINAVHNFDRTKIYEAYAQALQLQGRFAEALEAVNKALNLSPLKAKLLRAKSKIEFQIQTEIKSEITEEKVQPGKYWYIRHGSECRHISASQLSKLHCLYNRTASPFLYLAPFKMEILQLDPYVVLYYDVISDNEITSLKELVRPDLKRARVYDILGKKSATNNGRNAKSASVADDANDLIIRLHQRIADMTGFDLNDCEKLQITNYGLGGNFEPHYDFLGKSKAYDGNDTTIIPERLSTVLIYMSDVDQGGATVFPNINTSVKPQKGSALIWYNLDTDGGGDKKTLHVSCPVIVGSKWVAIKLIAAPSQIFRRPCLKKEN